MDVAETFGGAHPLVGMVHLPALPGAPDASGDREAVRDRALADARALVDGGVDALLVENYGDAPFYPDEVPSHVVAEMTALARDLRAAVDCPLGVNVLRNDASAAVAVAAAAGGAFVRVNVHTGVRATDQGLVSGTAHETLRLRDRLDADVKILADVAVKHSAPVGDRPLDQQVADAVDRGLADGLVVSGPGTGTPTATDRLEAVLDARDDVAPGVPVFVGSGVTIDNVDDLLAPADGAIVGTALKEGGETAAPVDRDRVADLVAAASDR